MKTTAHYSVRRTLVGLAAGLVLGVIFAATARADMYRLGLNYDSGTPAPYNAGGGIPIQPHLGSQTVTTTNDTLTWYGLLGNYGIEASTNLVTWHTVAHGLVTDYAWSQTVLKPDPTNAYNFRVSHTNWFVGQSACVSCHDKYIPYMTTKHSGAYSDPDAVANFSLACRSVGYGQPTGFIDASTTPNLENVGCENCHGAAGWHKTADHAIAHPAVSIDPAICGSCHQGNLHPTFEEYSTTLHSQVNDDIKYGLNSGFYYTNTVVISGKTSYGYYVTSTNGGITYNKTNLTTGIINSTNVAGSGIDSGQDRQVGCGICHSGAARMAMINDYEARLAGHTNALVLPSANDAGAWGPTCGVCHDPHAVHSYPLYTMVTNIIPGVSTNTAMVASGSQALQLRNPTWSSNYYTMATTADKRYDSSGKPYYMGTTFASLYNPNVQVCGQCHNTRGARWDGLAYGLITNSISTSQITNVVYVQIYTNITYTQVFTNTVPPTTNTYTYSQPIGWVASNVVVTVTNRAITVGLTTNVTGFSRAPHNSVQYNMLIGILQPDYLNTTNGKTVWTNSVLTNGIGIYASHSGIAARNPYNTNQCATCHMPHYAVDATHNVTGHTFELNTLGCALNGCHTTGVPDVEGRQILTTNNIQRVVDLLNTWATNKAPAILGAADYNKSKQNSWEYTAPGMLASITNTGPASTNQVKLPAAILQARFNVYMVRNDGSLGVHNPTFIPLLLSDAEAKVLSQFTTAKFTANTPDVLVGTAVTFANLNPGVTACTWNFGDGATYSTNNASPVRHIYSSASTNSVSLTATDGSGTETLTRNNYIKVYTVPTASFTATPTSGSFPLTVNFTNTSTGADYTKFTFYDGTGGTGRNNSIGGTLDLITSFNYTNAGTYKVIVTASVVGGSVTVTNTITVTP